MHFPFWLHHCLQLRSLSWLMQFSSLLLQFDCHSQKPELAIHFHILLRKTHTHFHQIPKAVFLQEVFGVRSHYNKSTLSATLINNRFTVIISKRWPFARLSCLLKPISFPFLTQCDLSKLVAYFLIVELILKLLLHWFIHILQFYVWLVRYFYRFAHKKF